MNTHRRLALIGFGLAAALWVSASAPAGAAPPRKALPNSSTGSFCLTPTFPQSFAVSRSGRPSRLHVSSPDYDLSCASVAWRSGGTQAHLDNDIILATKASRCVIFCDQALYDKAAGTIQLLGDVRVTTYLAGTTKPTVSTGDTGLVTLSFAAPQVVLHTDPVEYRHQGYRQK